MYEIYLFSGGVYKFDELKETVEDIGGLMLRKDRFHISRGASYLAEEIQVMLVVPEQDKKIIKSFSHEIKGTLDQLELEDLKRINILTYLSIYDVLNRTGSWTTLEEIEDLIECPCPAQLCNLEAKTCVLDELEKALDDLCQQNVVEFREKNSRIEYRTAGSGQILNNEGIP